jgi:chemotaxis methyl-accepting protein methylase
MFFHIYKVILQLTCGGCSLVYSLAILLKEMDLLCKSRLYATDISTKALDKSKKESTLLMTLKNIPLITFHVGRVSESIFCF